MRGFIREIKENLCKYRFTKVVFILHRFNKDRLTYLTLERYDITCEADEILHDNLENNVT